MENNNGGKYADELVFEAFTSPYHLEHEESVSTNNCYILHMDGSRVSNNKVAVGLSNHSCAVYDIGVVKKLQDLCGHKATVSNVKFSPQDDNLIYSSSNDGTIKLWDLRLKSKCVKEFKDDSEGLTKPLSDFDVSCNGKFVSGGTELVDDDAFILFWDTRSEKLLGGYWEYHMDVITQVKFHPQKQDTLMTGSTDGLINIYDISKSSEEDAIMQSLNTQSSVEKISWQDVNGKNDVLSCITHTQDLQMWHSDGAYPFLQFERDSISDMALMKARDGCFIVDVHETSNPKEILLLAGSTAREGKCLRTLRINLPKKKLKPSSNLVGNKQIARASLYHKDSEILVTGGEAGILSVWKPQTYPEKDIVSEFKMESSKKMKPHRKKPY